MMKPERAWGLTAVVAGVIVPALLATAWAVHDYRRWCALGVGGLPQSWRGWLRTTFWRLRKRNPFDLQVLRAKQGSVDDVATLAALPRRAGSRPRVAPHPVPHRQLTEQAPEAVRARLSAAFDARVAQDPERIGYALSHFEKTNQAVTLQARLCRHADARASHGEIAHIHPSDGSMHMVLSASDAATVVERGWGERHGLAGVALGLPLTYTLIYAPRDEAEVRTDADILDAAILYMAGAAGDP